jgi:hypothetical protein
MALVWLPLDDATIEAMLALARSSWERDELDAAWEAAGWAQPDDGPVSRLVFEEMEYNFAARGRRVVLAMGMDLDEIKGFAVEFATFIAESDPDDPVVSDLVPPEGPGAGWGGDLAADRQEFDAVWREACDRIGGRLGTPEVIGRHGDHWQHAVWRVGTRLLVVAQGEDFSSYGAYDDASVWVVRHPPEAAIPEGDKLYDLLVG